MHHTKKNSIKVAELRLSYTPPKTAIILSTSKEVEAALRSVWDTALLSIQEQFYVLYLNRRNELITWRCLHTGTSTSTQIDLRLLMALAFGCLAQSIVIAHNHPSGCLTPSNADIALTNKIWKACQEYDIAVLDHLILTETEYLSLADEGLM